MRTDPYEIVDSELPFVFHQVADVAVWLPGHEVVGWGIGQRGDLIRQVFVA